MCGSVDIVYTVCEQHSNFYYIDRYTVLLPGVLGVLKCTILVVCFSLYEYYSKAV